MTAGGSATNAPTRILGIDPGLQITGYAVVEAAVPRPRVCEAGIIRSQERGSKISLTQRLRAIYESLAEVLEQFQPQAIAVEQLYAHYAHPRTAILMAHARGVIFLAAARHDLDVFSYNATRIKKTITGSGHAPKAQMQRAIQNELGLPTLPEPPDVADALAVALCHLYIQHLPGGRRL